MKSVSELWQRILMHVLISVLGGFLSASIFFVSVPYRLSLPASVATVDMTGLIHAFVKTESTVSASPAQHQARVRVFSQQLDSALQSIAHEQHVILLPKEAVIAGTVRDVTSDVAQRLEKFSPTDIVAVKESEK